MFSLQTIFGKGDQFFNLLNTAAEIAVQSAGALEHLLEDHGTEATLSEFRLAREREKEVSAKISQALVDVFITPLEREDIEALGTAIYRIPKTIEKFADRYVLAGERLKSIDFGPRAAMLKEATSLVQEMVRHLPKMKLDAMKRLYDRLRSVEGEADRLMLETYREIYSGKYEGLQILLIKDFFELLEKAIDRCRTAGEVCYEITLKNS